MALSRNQAEYHARRAYQAEYARKMTDPHGPGRNRDRQDNASTSASLAYKAKMSQHGHPTDDVPEIN